MRLKTKNGELSSSYQRLRLLELCDENYSKLQRQTRYGRIIQSVQSLDVDNYGRG